MSRSNYSQLKNTWGETVEYFEAGFGLNPSNAQVYETQVIGYDYPVIQTETVNDWFNTTKPYYKGYGHLVPNEPRIESSCKPNINKTLKINGVT